MDTPGQAAPRQSPKLDALHHIAIQVDDIARATDWYRSRFSTQVEYQDDSWALLRFENISLALVKPEQHPAHIAFARPHAETFGRLSRHRDGSESVYIEDSEGNSVEIMNLTSGD